MSGLVHSDVFIFDYVIRITLKASEIRILLSIGSLNDKKIAFRRVTPDFLSNFPFAKLQNKSIVKGLRPTTLVLNK